MERRRDGSESTYGESSCFHVGSRMPGFVSIAHLAVFFDLSDNGIGYIIAVVIRTADVSDGDFV